MGTEASKQHPKPPGLTPDEQSVLDKGLDSLRKSVLNNRVPRFFGSVSLKICLRDGKVHDANRIIVEEIDT